MHETSELFATRQVATSQEPAGGRQRPSGGPGRHGLPRKRPAPPPPGSLALSIMKAGGGVGATRLYSMLLRVADAPPGRQLVAREVPIPKGKPLAAPDDGSVRLLVVRATCEGARLATQVRGVDSDGLVVVAIEDGIPGPHIPRAARRYLKSVTSIVPVVVVPYHHPWRYDPDAAPGRRYRRALQRVVTAALQVEYQTKGRDFSR